MNRNDVFWIVFIILLLAQAIASFMIGLSTFLVIMPLVFSVLFLLIYLNKKLGGILTIKKERNEKWFAFLILIVVPLIVTTVMFIKNMGMNVIMASIVVTIATTLNYVRLYIFKKERAKK